MFQKSDASLPQKYLGNIRKKTLRALLVKELVFNNELVIRDIGYCINKQKYLVLNISSREISIFQEFSGRKPRSTFSTGKTKKPTGDDMKIQWGVYI